MTTEIRFTIATLLIAVISWGCHSQSTADAHKLLDDYMENSMSVRRSAASKIEILDELNSQAQSLKGRLPDNFYERFQHLVATTRLFYTPNRDEPTLQAINAYIQDITGAPPPKGVTDFEKSIESLTGKPSKGDMNLSMSAAFAFSEEVLRLNMLLDGETNREKARQKYAERLRAKRK